jgi:hypothetical protein
MAQRRRRRPGRHELRGMSLAAFGALDPTNGSFHCPVGTRRTVPPFSAIERPAYTGPSSTGGPSTNKSPSPPGTACASRGRQGPPPLRGRPPAILEPNPYLAASKPAGELQTKIIHPQTDSQRPAPLRNDRRFVMLCSPRITRPATDLRSVASSRSEVTGRPQPIGLR